MLQQHSTSKKLTSIVQSLKGVAGRLKQPLNWKKVKKIAYEDRFKNRYGK